MKDYTNESPAFSDKIKILETTDTDHADNFNKFAKQLLDNDIALKALFDEFVGRIKEIAFSGSYDDLEDKPEKFPPASHKHAKADITNFPSSMPASDVYSWAKAANKPSYSWSEIGSKPGTFPPSSHSHNYAASNHSHSHLSNLYIDIDTNKTAWIRANLGSTYSNMIQFADAILSDFDSIYHNFSHLCGSTHTKGQAHRHAEIASHVNLMRLGWGLFVYNPYTNLTIIATASYGGGIGLQSYTSETNGTTCSSFYLYPVKDNLGYLGASDKRWKQLYAVNGTISTSDARMKKDISYIGRESNYDTKLSDSSLMTFIMELKPVVFRRKDGESGRPHHGLISQDVEEALKTAGITDHAGFIKSPKTKSVEKERETEKTVKKEDGTVETVKGTEKYTTQEEIPGEYIYSLRYEEFIADLLRFCQILYDKSVEQDEKIASLEERMARMETEAMFDKAGDY